MSRITSHQLYIAGEWVASEGGATLNVISPATGELIGTVPAGTRGDVQRAIDADPNYADAVFNLALFLQRLEKHAPAAQWWRRYLELDGSSLWAARARRALKFCEIQIAGSS